MLEIISKFNGPVIILNIVAVLNFVLVLFTARQKASENQQSLMLLTVLSTIAACGYLFRALSDSLRAVVISEKMILLCGSFVSYRMFLFFTDFCGWNLSKPLRRGMFSLAVVNAAITTTFNCHSLMYRSYDLSTENGLTTFVSVSGVWAYVYRAIYLFYFVLIFVVALQYIQQESGKRKSAQAWMLMISTVLPGVSFLLQLGGQWLPVPVQLLQPITILISESLLFYLVLWKNLFDLHDVAREEAFVGMQTAMIVTGNDGTFQGANPYAVKLFPELEHLSIKQPMPEREDLRALLAKEQPDVTINDRIYEADLREICKDGVPVGSALWLTDVTGKRAHIQLLTNYKEELEEEVRRKVQKIQDLQAHIVLSMSDLIENRDDNTGGHVKRTSTVVSYLVHALLADGYPGVDRDFCETVIRTAPLHDLGKIAVSDLVLRKPGKLTDEEFDAMKKHSVIGADMAANVLSEVDDPEILRISENIAHAHHEKWNGFGYPDRISGEDIPLEARIMAIADVYDALLSKRSYKEPMSFEEAYSIMEDSFGSHFDPSLKKYFEQCRGEIEAYYAAQRAEEAQASEPAD